MGKKQYRDKDTHTNVRVHNPTHERLSQHNRESETLAGTIDRALDALEREQELPDAIREALHDDED
jgi:hypothetical protein